MKWADIRAELTKGSVRKKERLALLKSIESAWSAGGTDEVETWVCQKIDDTTAHAGRLQSRLLASSGAQDEEATDEYED